MHRYAMNCLGIEDLLCEEQDGTVMIKNTKKWSLRGKKVLAAEGQGRHRDADTFMLYKFSKPS